MENQIIIKVVLDFRMLTLLHQESVYLKAEETHYRAFHGVAVLYLFFI
jgi:hypothetical protein